MAKVNGPLFSMEVSGTVGGTLVYSKWKGQAYVRERVIPSNPRSAAQTGIRSMMKFLAREWAGLSSIIKSGYEALASANGFSPFNAYMRANMNRWVDSLVPSQAIDAAGSNTPATVSALTLTGGSGNCNIAITLSTAANQWGVIVYRSPAAITVLDRSTAVAVIPVDGDSTLNYLDSGLEPGTYHYRVAAITDDGVLGTAIADDSEAVS